MGFTSSHGWELEANASSGFLLQFNTFSSQTQACPWKQGSSFNAGTHLSYSALHQVGVIGLNIVICFKVSLVSNTLARYIYGMPTWKLNGITITAIVP
ncbi:hypothetical protein CC2G_000449 [Coprinopsis cinerea AmutBmut pab1-1]|nr:hypothetical protein CC2G_000449 [Coprinopsis cinerea AmutBmut pab1-1]